MNVWTFSGNVGNDAETRFTPGGDAVVSFSVAVKSGFGDKAVTTWARCQMWGKRGQSVAPYLVKGQLVGVSGEATLREYDKKDGGKGSSLEVRVNDVTLMGKKGDQPDTPRTTPQPGTQTRQAAPAATDPLEDDIPF